MLRYHGGGRRGWVLVLTVLTIVAGTGASVAMGALLARGQRAAGEREFARRSDLVSAAVSAQTGRYIDGLRTVAAATGAFTTLTAVKYTQVTGSLRDMQLAGAAAVVFLVPATTAQIPAVQSHWRARGAPDLVLKPGGNNRDHIFAIYSTPLPAAGVTVSGGTDATRAVAPTQAMRQAQASGRVTVSDPYQLIIDQNQPAGEWQRSFVLTVPVYEPPDAQGRRVLRGWVVMAVRWQDFMGATLRNFTQDLLDVTLSAQSADRALVPVAHLNSPSPGGRDLHRVMTVKVENRRWQLNIQAHAASFPGAHSLLPAAVASGGSVLALMLAALIYLLATGRDRAQATANAATAELREQKSLLEAIMDSVSAGILVVDDRGEFILTNPAAAPYLRIGGQDLTNSRWTEHTQLFHGDGVTPFAASDLPMARALAGESSHGVEIVARSPRSEEVVFHAGARPLDRRAGRSGAVAVFYDITTRKHAEEALAKTAASLSVELALREKTETELRLRETELTAFAGIVAHDLKAPLRAVSGFISILQDDLTTALPGGLDDACIHSMDRIVTATQRMSQLIDNLLSFATARDRPLNRQPVDLQVLVAEIVAERTSYPPEGSLPEQAPTIEVGPLPVLQADPMMCRQLLDNLIGNALKYTQPGQGAHIQIHARHEPDDWIQIDVIDRGVGIPPGQHEQVFTAFQRAHTGYAGTGLGLAICQRVVERHGGTIAAADNPAGGTRFHFTLPSAVDPAGPRLPPEGSPSHPAAAAAAAA
jgi:PAS domain S-box-containing protein